MKPHITKYLAWLAMALTLSSCSCCRVEPPVFTPEDEKFFSKYKIGDTIKLASDTLKLDIVLKNISYSTEKSRGNIVGRNCYAGTNKKFNFEATNYDTKNFRKTTMFDINFVRGNFPDGESPNPAYSYHQFVRFNTGSFNKENLVIDGSNYKNVVEIPVYSQLDLGKVDFLIIDSTGFLIATYIRNNNNIIYK